MPERLVQYRRDRAIQGVGTEMGGEIRTLDYARLVCPLWQSCRSMLARIDMLEERVAQLSAP